VVKESWKKSALIFSIRHPTVIAWSNRIIQID
jgi:hypothetical protein